MSKAPALQVVRSLRTSSPAALSRPVVVVTTEPVLFEPALAPYLGREVFLYFPNGIAGARLPMSAVEKAIGTPGTCRNWTTITKLLAMGEELDAEG